jgi:S-adenosylmethionine decarboxylase
MTHLAPEARTPFYFPQSSASPPLTGHEAGRAISDQLGLGRLFPSDTTHLDSYAFEPCGYSANAIIGSGQAADGEGGYYTIHVTPEDGWSYASFECNVPLPPSVTPGAPAGQGIARRPDLPSLIRSVVDVFKPSRLSITLFVSTASTPTEEHADSIAGTDVEKRAWTAFGADLFGDYDRKDRIGYEFDGYDLVFACFQKRGWVEPKALGANVGSGVGADA